MNVTTTTHRGQRCFYWRQDGQKRYRVIKDEAKLDQERTALIIELSRGPKAKTIMATLDQHVTDYTDFLRAEVNEKWADMTAKRIRRIIVAGKIKKLADITVATVATAIASLRCTPRRPQQPPESYPLLSENSRNHHKQAIKSFMLWLLDEERIETYLRRGELASLTPDSFRLAEKVLVVSSEATKNGDPATCRLPAKLLPGLRAWLRGRVGPVFPALKIKRVCKLVRLDLIEAGLPVETPDGRRTFHSLRNAFITMLWDRGVSGPQVMKAARHATMEQSAAYDRSLPVEAAIIDSLVE